MKTRNVTDELASNIQIIDGELSMIDGSDLKEYLSSWQKDGDIDNGTCISIVPREQLFDFEQRYIQLLGMLKLLNE